MTKTPVLRVISLGAGVQSTTLALMAASGELGAMPDCAIFADTQGEPAAVYEHLKWLMSPGVLPFPVHIVTAGSLWKSASTVRRTRDGERTYISTGIPVYLAEGLRKGIGKRQCTRTYKIDPINREVRRLLGLKRVLKSTGVLAEMMIGISTDEASRMKPSAMPWIRATWPLIDKGMSRDDCVSWMSARGVSAPRSACTFCPFRDDNSWSDLSPGEFADVVEKERHLQASYAETTEMRGTPFFHASRVPLDAVQFSATPADQKPAQLRTFNNECEGMCGV